MARPEAYRLAGKRGGLLRAEAALDSAVLGVVASGTVLDVADSAVVVAADGGPVERFGVALGDSSVGWFSAKLAVAAPVRSHGWEVETSGWSAYDVDDDGRDLDALFEAARADGAPVRFVTNRMRYVVDVAAGTQTNERFGTTRRIRRRRRRRPPPPRLSPPGAAPRSPTRVFAVSDLHVDYAENMAWLRALPVGPFRGDVLVVAGDLGHTLPLLAAAFARLKEVFRDVCFCVGNHELWVGFDGERGGAARGAGAGTVDGEPVAWDGSWRAVGGSLGGKVGRPRVLDDLDPAEAARAETLAAAAVHAVPTAPRRAESLLKFGRVVALCAALGVATGPLEVEVDDGEPLHICPLLSWYTHGFARGAARTREAVAAARRTFSDFELCEWGDLAAADPDFDGDDGPAAYFAARNAETNVVPAAATRVVTFSHFLPRPELMPTQSAALHLDLCAGDARLERQLRARRSKLHVFGHTHVNWDACADGVHYVQNALRYPRERQRWASRVDAVHAERRAARALDALEVWTSARPDHFCILPRRCAACKFEPGPAEADVA